MTKAIVRTDKWQLNPSAEIKAWQLLTVVEYRSYCKALSYVVMGHWPELSKADSFCSSVEKLIHKTAKNLNPKHSYFGKRFYKFPSYLRRAAIEFVKGQVSSYMTRYRDWQSGVRKHRFSRPPVFNPSACCYPAMYKGQLFKMNSDLTVASLKLWNGREWLWNDVQITGLRQRHLTGKILSPQMIVGRSSCHLSVPFKIQPTKLEGDIVCSVDIGINTLATASIVCPCGTVLARRFFHPASDIDRRDKQATIIKRKARKTAKLHKGFCKTHYRKVANINKNIGHQVSRQIVNFALEFGASVVVFEDLKGWRPKGGKKCSNLKRKFHGWLHRQLTNYTEQKFQEVGGRVEYVYARGTSSWAFDGSGRTKRSKKQYELATFANGKQYNADLSASYNIGARYWAWKLKLTHRKDGQVERGKSTRSTSRMPITLSALWDREAAYGRLAS